jgi:hypothetical protein
MIQTKLELLTTYAVLNLSETFNNLLQTYKVTFDLNPLIAYVKEVYKGYEKQSIIINLLNIHEEEIAFMDAESFIHA